MTDYLLANSVIMGEHELMDIVEREGMICGLGSPLMQEHLEFAQNLNTPLGGTRTTIRR